jgi:hypothetical protein
MSLNAESLEIRWSDSHYGLSARRLWEHAELGQTNVFGNAINSRFALNNAAAFIDVIWFGGEIFALAGFTLVDLRAGHVPTTGIAADFPVPGELANGTAALAFERSVAGFLYLRSARKAARNQAHPFLPPAQTGDVFGVPLIFSSLQRRLCTMGTAKASAGQWLKTVENLQAKGLRAEEFNRSNLMPELAALDSEGGQVSAIELAGMCSFEGLRLSVIPVMKDAQRQLRFTTTPAKKIRRTKRLPKAQAGQTRAAIRFDPVLGYRIEQVEHATLWGEDRHWQAVAHDGQVIGDAGEQSLRLTAESAAEVAARHAKLHFPKRVALGQWSHIAWTGGEAYREWLITLPFWPASYFSSHFQVRNVLAHVRCDVREGAAGERVLLLQEVQSDWAQDARRAISCGDLDPADDECPPFLKEWPALAMKLVLLHAAHQGLDAVAWTRGTHQAQRYKGLGATGLVELYDRALPREVNRMLKTFGGACEKLGVFVPTNFRIRQSESGYDVFAADNRLLGTAATLDEARAFVPDGAHELLYEVHAVRLPNAMRQVILAKGFPAWG